MFLKYNVNEKQKFAMQTFNEGKLLFFFFYKKRKTRSYYLSLSLHRKSGMWHDISETARFWWEVYN